MSRAKLKSRGVDARTAWATAPPAARQAGEEIYRVFDSPAEAVAFIAGRARHAERQRLYRQRQRDRTAVLRVAVAFDDVVEALISSGRISEEDALDRAKVETATSGVVLEWSKGW